MDWIIILTAILGALGVLWALRDYFTGSTIVDERDPTAPQTEAERDAIRARDQTRK
ncbi:hypothetical protein L0664_05175 [Octadecabacter sp. G9-8]|uniref:Uncharacterized protein n=1 Tax=Octadecabacter dasysiphoniae TaxID=2909341 RepID=A0ABS9CTQ2_9RHOB|nr:hypothetical protein [Octadecabacter dasysiphoniae]MCF2870452.1 hypothetical protein [Octadecabacter dasysiphoniae]